MIRLICFDCSDILGKPKKEIYFDDVRRITESMNNVPMETKEQRSCLAMSRIDLVAVPIPPIDIPLSKVKELIPYQIKANLI